MSSPAPTTKNRVPPPRMAVVPVQAASASVQPLTLDSVIDLAPNCAAGIVKTCWFESVPSASSSRLKSLSPEPARREGEVLVGVGLGVPHDRDRGVGRFDRDGRGHRFGVKRRRCVRRAGDGTRRQQRLSGTCLRRARRRDRPQCGREANRNLVGEEPPTSSPAEFVVRSALMCETWPPVWMVVSDAPIPSTSQGLKLTEPPPVLTIGAQPPTPGTLVEPHRLFVRRRRWRRCCRFPWWWWARCG